MIITYILGSLSTPLYQQAALYAGADQTIRMQLQPLVSGGIAGFSFVLTIKPGYDGTPGAAIAGVVNDASNCIVDFAIPAATTKDFVGRYVFDIRRTDAGNDGPTTTGQLNAIRSVGP